MFNKHYLSGKTDSFVCFSVRDGLNKFTYYRFSDQLSILSFCIDIQFVTEHESSVCDYFEYEDDLNKSRFSIVDEKEKSRDKRCLWTIMSFQDFEVWTKTRTKTRTKMIRGIRMKTRTKMICKIEIKLKLKWLLSKK